MEASTKQAEFMVLQDIFEAQRALQKVRSNEDLSHTTMEPQVQFFPHFKWRGTVSTLSSLPH